MYKHMRNSKRNDSDIRTVPTQKDFSGGEMQGFVDTVEPQYKYYPASTEWGQHTTSNLEALTVSKLSVVKYGHLKLKVGV